MDGLECSEGTWWILLKCGGLQIWLRFLCLGTVSSSLYRFGAQKQTFSSFHSFFLFVLF